jgi:Aspartyl/Asparaginyl beta-hydroxylase
VIFKTNLQIDLPRLVKDLSRYIDVFDQFNQLSIVYDENRLVENIEPHYVAIGKSTPDIDQWNLNKICPLFANSYFAEIFDLVPYKKQRARIMRMAPRSTYSMHVDSYKRLHWALITDPSCHLTFQNNEQFFGWHIPANGFAYLVDTRKMHSAVNPWDQYRYHFVIDIKD